MFRLLTIAAVLATGQARFVPRPKMLAVHSGNSDPLSPSSKEKTMLSIRGGVTTDQLINTMGYLYLVTGLQGWLAPKTTMATYGAEDITAEDACFLRFLSSFNVVAGSTLLASESEATTLCLTGWALATTANTPLMEPMDVPKGPLVGTIALLGTLGELTRQGKLEAALAGKILAFLLIPVSIGEIVAPEKTLEAFGVPSPTGLSKSLMENFSFTKISTGMYLLVGKLTGKRGLGFAGAMASNAVNVVRTIQRSDDVGLKKGGLIAWGVLNTAAALFAIKNE